MIAVGTLNVGQFFLDDGELFCVKDTTIRLGFVECEKIANVNMQRDTGNEMFPMDRMVSNVQWYVN